MGSIIELVSEAARLKARVKDSDIEIVEPFRRVGQIADER